jgi:DNA-binding MarR family transcriptional regulator
MDARGLVTRRSDPTDGRRVRVFLTPQGRALARELVADARAHELELLKSFQGGDGSEIKETLRALIRHLEADQPGQPGVADSPARDAAIADS